MSRVVARRIALVSLTIALLLGWVLVERTFAAIADGLEAAVEVSRVSADAAGSVDELSKGFGTLIGSVDRLATDAQSLATDASDAATSVSEAASGSVGTAIESTGRTAGRLAPAIGFVEGLTGGSGAKKDLESLAESLKPVPGELDRIAGDLSATAASLDKTAASLDSVHAELGRTKATVDGGRASLRRLPAAAKQAEAAASGPLERLRFNLWLWRLALLAIWVTGVVLLLGKSNRSEHESQP
jgi:phage-related tail protein